MDLAELRDRMSVVFHDHMCYELNATESIAAGDLGRAAHGTVVIRSDRLPLSPGNVC